MQVRLNPISLLHWRQWNTEYIVFDEKSGQTHLLDQLTACTLLCIEDGVIDQSGLISKISEYTLLTEDSISEALPGVFEQLIGAALIETSPG